MKPGLVCLTFLFLLGLASSPAEGLFPGREIAKPLEEVRDSFLGYFVGIVDADATGHADAAYLHEVLPEFTSFLSMPFEEIRDVSRRREGAHVVVTIVFRRSVSIPIPFRVLFDTPGTIAAAERVRFLESRLGAAELGDRPSRLEPVYLFDLVEGELSIDFDPWIDVLFGRAVDDVKLTRIMLFGHAGRWYGALMGKGYQGQLVVGYFDFTGNRILLPMPRFLRDVGARFAPP